jgi:hypothetical protein
MTNDQVPMTNDLVFVVARFSLNCGENAIRFVR